ncbi:hypothetical protein [Candidatus Methylomirabilis sp.]|uniref:hypothetical protein n=1 Tax=Candidatus Methylomirabilis sp. TaxID=2032687 RepID=UPI002A64F013|nr:hypothetical protein [Candidatus Methylomirabilis sp.]
MRGNRNGDERRSLHAYRLYGVCVRSQWRLPYPDCTETNHSAIELVEEPPTFFEGAAQEAAGQPNAAEWAQYVHLRDDAYYLRWSELFEFLVSADGCRIAGRPLTHVAFEAFHTYLLGAVLSFSLIKRGLDPLHATTVVIDGGAVGFLGDTGYGKSSLGGAFIQAGYPVLTDDLLLLREGKHGFSASPGPPRIKLYPRIARKLLGEYATGVPMNPLTRKLIIPLGRDQVHQAPVALKALYLLPRPSAPARRKRVTVRRVSQHSAFLALLKSAFNTEIIDSERLRRQFLLCTRIASTVPVKLLSYPRSLASLPSVREAILADLNKA